jgi:hypothetical protein
VVAAPRLSPWLLFGGVKSTEALFHLRPRALLRLFHGGDRRVRRILRSSLALGARVVAAEVAEFLFATRFVARGSSGRLPRRGRGDRRGEEEECQGQQAGQDESPGRLGDGDGRPPGLTAVDHRG